MARASLPAAYQAVFDRNKNAAATAVLGDLAKFCRAMETCLVVASDKDGGRATVDPLATAVAEGRREVFLRIMRMLKIDIDEIHRVESDYERQRSGERD